MNRNLAVFILSVFNMLVRPIDLQQIHKIPLTFFEDNDRGISSKFETICSSGFRYSMSLQNSSNEINILVGDRSKITDSGAFINLEKINAISNLKKSKLSVNSLYPLQYCKWYHNEGCICTIDEFTSIYMNGFVSIDDVNEFRAVKEMGVRCWRLEATLPHFKQHFDKKKPMLPRCRITY